MKKKKKQKVEVLDLGIKKMKEVITKEAAINSEIVKENKN